MANKLKSKTRALLICFLLTSTSFASGVPIAITEKEEAVLAALNNEIKLNSNSIIGNTITTRAAKIKSIIENDNKKMSNAKITAKTSSARGNYPEVKTKNERAVVKNTWVENTAVKNTIAKNPAIENTTAQNTVVKNPTVENTAVESPTVKSTVVKNTTVENTVVKNHTVENTAVESPTAKNTVVENTGIKIITDSANNKDNKKPTDNDNTNIKEFDINTYSKTTSDKKENKKEDKKDSNASSGNTNSSVKEIPFADNEQVKAVLSNRDINRILVKGDKIQSVNGPTGLYTAKNDTSGSVYISLYSSASFTLFLSTVNGHNLSLLISPKTTTGRTIILEPTSPSLLPTHPEETDTYQKLLITLITNMINNEALEDYAYIQTKKPKPKNFYNIAEIKEIASYNGSHLLGIISEIKNKSKGPIVLKPSYFYKPGTRAVALSKQTIASHETGLLYQVISRDQN